MTTRSQLHEPLGCGQLLRGRPGLRTSTNTRSLWSHFDERCPRMQGPLSDSKRMNNESSANKMVLAPVLQKYVFTKAHGLADYKKLRSYTVRRLYPCAGEATWRVWARNVV